MCTFLNPNGNITIEDEKRINQNLLKFGIPTRVDELVDQLPNLIPESRFPRKFKDVIKLSST